eukprot:Skav231901  [mRNA]  locus=scaffold960:209259:223730:+ [translate_table: standard]
MNGVIMTNLSTLSLEKCCSLSTAFLTVAATGITTGCSSLLLGRFLLLLFCRCWGRLLILPRDGLEESHEGTQGHHASSRVQLHEREGLLGIRRHKSADEQGDAHDGGTNACRSSIVDWLEVLREGQLLVLWLQGVSSPLVARRRQDAGCPDHEGEHEGLLGEALWLEDEHRQGIHEASSPAVDDVAHHGGDVCLIQIAETADLPAHALAESVVGDGQHDCAEEEAADESAHTRAEGGEGHRHVDDLEDRELQHVGWEGGEEEVGDQLHVHLLHCLAHRHALHQQSVDQRFADGGQNGSHECRSGTLSSGRKDLAKEVGSCRHGVGGHHRLISGQSAQGPAPHR